MTKSKLSKEELELKSKQQQAKLVRAREKKFLKEEVEMLELEYKYINYMLELPKLRQTFQEALKQSEELLKESAKKSVEKEENKTKVVDLKPGTEVENKE